MEERSISFTQDYIWGSVTFPNGSTAIAVVGEEDGRGYYLSHQGTRVLGIVGFREGNEKIEFDGYIDELPFRKDGISVLKAHRYLAKFGNTLRHPVIADIELEGLLF